MSLSTADQLAAIARHSEGLAAAARDRLHEPVEHCPGWDVADLVWHVTEVHWFWGTIVEELLTAPPDASRRPDRPADDALVNGLATGARRLVAVLGAADQAAHCWTWARWRQDVAFVTRHQVQEAVVHHWDAAHTTGARWQVAAEVAADSVDEFLHFSVASDDDPDEPVKPPLDGTFALAASDTGETWRLTDGARPGTVRVDRVKGGDGPLLSAPAEDLLLWLYGRQELDGGSVPAALLARFRAMLFTD